jgi:3-keto-disaccharide hydrolase
MYRLRPLVLLWILVVAPVFSSYGLDNQVRSDKVIRLFNGKDLTNFDTWLVDFKDKDPDKVFSVVDQVDGAPAIRASGQHWGGLITQQEFSNYRLIVEFRWGLLTWGERKSKARDSGILVHAQGPEGNYSKDFNGPWMRSIEFQIIEGGTGDFILVNGYNQNGELVKISLAATTAKDRDGETIFDPSGKLNSFQGQPRINWYGRDPDWEDRLGFRGKEDVESPAGQWTRVEAVCDGDTITNIVNGRVVNKAIRLNQTSGKILLQSEGAEIFFRRVDLEPLAK